MQKKGIKVSRMMNGLMGFSVVVNFNDILIAPAEKGFQRVNHNGMDHGKGAIKF